ncbi:MAG TPA: hypothetical protein VGV18_06515, partial [Verrucomicrobiae bacterium]|nr:hypothetical protein [Verrucomicrobiae bacterium]
MKPDSATIKRLRFATLSDSSVRVRCEICAFAALVEIGIYLTFTATDSEHLLRGWVMALDVGLVFGTV